MGEGGQEARSLGRREDDPEHEQHDRPERDGAGHGARARASDAGASSGAP